MRGTSEAIRDLLRAGYRVNRAMIESYIRNGALHAPGVVVGRRIWTDDDLRRLRAVLELNGNGPARASA